MFWGEKEGVSLFTAGTGEDARQPGEGHEQGRAHLLLYLSWRLRPRNGMSSLELRSEAGRSWYQPGLKPQSNSQS